MAFALQRGVGRDANDSGAGQLPKACKIDIEDLVFLGRVGVKPYTPIGSSTVLVRSS